MEKRGCTHFGSGPGVAPALKVMSLPCSYLHFTAIFFASLLYHMSLRQDTRESLIFERVRCLEHLSLAWKARAQPLYHTRIIYSVLQGLPQKITLVLPV